MKIFEIHLFGLTLAPTYYGFMYAAAFLIGYAILYKKRFLSQIALDDLFIYVFLGVVIGGRLGYILFYDLSYYLQKPLDIFKVWEGGMSFHGGFLGVILFSYLFSKKYNLSYLKLMDELAVLSTLGLFLGRIGNYLNKELLGFPYSGFLAVEKDGILFFPSPLLEAFLEGILLFFILIFINKNKRFDGQTSVAFLFGYGMFRIMIELFVRTPDSQIGYIFGFFTLGSFLSFPMLIGAIVLYFFSKKYAKHLK